jgi:biotin operon repressor
MGQAESRDAAALQLPARPPQIVKAPFQDRRKFCVIPWQAVQDWELPATSLRYLAALAAYANPAGLTWVSLKRVGEDLGVSHVAVHKHMTRLKNRGYVEEVSKGWKGEKAATRRIIYDEDITPEDAVAINSGKEDCRDPDMKRKEEQMARKNKQATTEAVQEPNRTQQNLTNSNLEEVKQTARLTLDEAIRVMQSCVVNVDETAVRWLEMALELGATRAMLETVAREGDPVAALKVLVTRLDRACR